MAGTLLAEEMRYTFADYLEWEGNERLELLDGEPLMQATPHRIHQKVSAALARLIGNYLEGKQCEVYPAPFTVRLFEQDGDAPEDVQTVFEPDISVICDKSKLDRYGCKGAPDLVIEILSPSTRRIDQWLKFQQYQRAGVREYWIVDPERKNVQVFLLEGKFLQLREMYEAADVAKVHVLDGCVIELSRVFTE